MQAKSSNQIESELIADAIKNAVARRSMSNEIEDTLRVLSEDEVDKIIGGQKVPVVVTSGLIEVPQEVM